jgi:predicted amidohydrolase YtcJ
MLSPPAAIYRPRDPQSSDYYRCVEAPLTVKEAVRLWTVNSAYESFEENLKGTLEPGKLADIVILGDDPFKVDKKHIEEIPVVETWVGGKKVDFGK